MQRLCCYLEYGLLAAALPLLSWKLNATGKFCVLFIVFVGNTLRIFLKASLQPPAVRNRFENKGNDNLWQTRGIHIMHNKLNTTNIETVSYQQDVEGNHDYALQSNIKCHCRSIVAVYTHNQLNSHATNSLQNWCILRTNNSNNNSMYI